MYGGLDSSLNATGYCVLDASGKIVVSGVWKPKAEGQDRLLYLYTRIRILLRKLECHLFSLEGYAFSRYGRAFQMGEAGGVSKLGLMISRQSHLIVQPTTLKKFATGYGRCDKETIIRAFYKETKQKPETHDEADAYFLAQIAKAFHSWPHCEYLNTEQYQVVAKLRRNQEGHLWNAS